MKFECQESCGGKCCTLDWRHGSIFIFLTKADRERLSLHTGLHVTKFAKQSVLEWTRFTGKKTTQWHLDNPKGQCRFFKNGKCSVYEARPTQCRTFPYWPENARAGEFDKLASVCPGVGHGEEATASKFREQAIADEELRAQ